MINRYFQPTRYQGNFYTPPLEMLGKVLESAQKQYDQNFALSEQIKNKYINSLSQDRATANAIQQGWETKVDEIVKKYSGDYSQASKDLTSLLSDMQREYNPGGRAHAIEYNYKTWTENWAKVQEGVQKGDHTSKQASIYSDWFNRTYKGIGEQDPTTGAYNIISPQPLAKYVDEYKLLQEAVSKVPRRSTKTVVPVSDGKGHIIMKEVEQEYVSPGELQTAAAQTLLNNDAWVSYVQQIATLQGDDPTAALNESLSNAVNNVTPLYSGLFKNNDIQKIEYDQIYLQNMRDQSAWARMKYAQDAATQRMLLKDSLDNPQTVQEDLMRISTRTDGNAQFNPINKEDGIWVGPDVLSTLNPFGNNFGGRKKQVSIQQILADPNNQAYRSQVNVEMLAAARKSAMQWRDKSGAASKDLDALTMDIYNEALKTDHYATGAYIRRFSGSKAMEEQAQRLAPQLQAGTVDIWQLDENTGQMSYVESADERKKISSQLWDSAKGKFIQPALGMTSVQTGLPFGTAFARTDKPGYYVVGEMHEDIRNMNLSPYKDDQGRGSSLFEKAFGYMHTPSRNQGGGIFEFGYGGQKMRAFGKVDYEVTEDGRVVPRGHYYDEHNQIITKPDGTPWTPADMEEVLLPPSYRSRFNPKGASKAQQTQFPEYLEIQD